jgi:hypothetical protein
MCVQCSRDYYYDDSNKICQKCSTSVGFGCDTCTFDG